MSLFRLVKRLLRVRVKENFEYRIEWLFMILMALTTCVSAPVFWYLFTGGGEFNGWSFVQLTILSVIGSLSTNLTYIIGLDPWIRTYFKEKLAVYMTKPVNPLFYMTLRYGGVTPISSVIIYILFLIFIQHTFNVEVNPLAFLIFLIFSVMIHMILFFFILIVAINWYDTAESFDNLIYNFLYLSKNPLDKIKRGLLSIILIPFMFVAVYPSKAFTGDLPVDWIWVGEVFLTLSFVLLLEYKLWERGLKRYESFGG